LNNQLLAVAGALSGFVVESGGSGWDSGVSIEILGDGTGASAHAEVSNGTITKVILDSEGSGYSYATVNAIGFGIGAEIRVILAPPKGHGAEPVNEFFSDAVSFYSTFSSETNQGIAVNNDYRQVSIMKSPLKFGGEMRLFQDQLGSTCYLLGTNYSNTNLLRDEILTRTQDGKRVRVVAIDGSNILVLPVDQMEVAITDNF
jgi:hypothetical protein